MCRRQAQGLLSTYLPPAAFSNVSITPQSFVLQPQDEVQISTSVQVDSAASPGAASMTQIAGAVIEDWREQSGFANLWLPLNESSGSRIFRDFSGLVPPHNGTCVGSHCPAAGADGYADYALDFDGTNDYVTLPGADELGLKNNSFTVAAWINGRAFGSGDRAILHFASLKRAILNGPGPGYDTIHLQIRFHFHSPGLKPSAFSRWESFQLGSL